MIMVMAGGSDNSFGAAGRGGQHIIVDRSINAIVVTTGGGFEYDQIERLLSAAVIDPANPLPANPEGVGQLNAMLDSLVKSLPALPVGEAPETIQVISGKPYNFEPNPVMLERATLDFSDPAEARIDLSLFGSDATWRVGLDDQYRWSPDGSLQRGYWKDARTFVSSSRCVPATTICIR
jgi:hypothetical protein